MKKPAKTKGQAGWIFLAVVVVVVVVIVAIVVSQQGRGTTPETQVPGAAATCFTYCLGVVEFQCGDNEVMGVCFGTWGCDAEIGAHVCR